MPGFTWRNLACRDRAENDLSQFVGGSRLSYCHPQSRGVGKNSATGAKTEGPGLADGAGELAHRSGKFAYSGSAANRGFSFQCRYLKFRIFAGRRARAI